MNSFYFFPGVPSGIHKSFPGIFQELLAYPRISSGILPGITSEDPGDPFKGTFWNCPRDV